MPSGIWGAGLGLVIVAVFGDAVGAECLDGSALDRGVAVHFTDGRVMAVTRRDGALLQMNVTVPEDGRLRPAGRNVRHAWHGVFVTLWDRVKSDGAPIRIETTFLETPPVPVAGVKGALVWVEGDATGEVPYQVGWEQSVAVGGCQYEALRVMLKRRIAEGWWVAEDHWYFPALGFGLDEALYEVTAMEPLP